MWILIVYIVQFVVGMVVMIPMMVAMVNRMAPMVQGDPHRFDNHPELVQQMMMQSLGPMMSNMMTAFAIITAVVVLLVAAATVRRLHDGDHSGWWAPVVGIQLATPLVYAASFPKFLAAFPTIRPDKTPEQMNAAMAPAMQSMAWVSLLGTIAFLMVILLIVVLALQGSEGPNRYGEDPIAF